MAVVVITGASSGIGEATAIELAKRGHQLVLAARREDRLTDLAKRLGDGAAVEIVPTDVAAPGALEALAQRAGERFGRIDVWINNAGVGLGGTWWDLEPERIRHTVDVNLVAPLLSVRAALPWMLPHRTGHFINVASVAGHVGVAGVYSATKFGLRGHTDSLRRELAQYGVKVSLISPGFIQTEITRENPMRMPPPSIVARAIASVIERPRREVVVPGWYRFLIGFSRVFPGLTDRMVSRWVIRNRPSRPRRPDDNRA